MSRTRLMTAAALVTVGVLLSGCGSASPGVAVEVGDREISHTRIDEATTNLCTALGEQFESQGTTVPMSFVRQSVVQLLTVRSQAAQIADEYGVELGSTYANDVAQRRDNAASMPEETRADYVDLTSANAMANDVLQQVGRVILEDEGITDPSPEQIGQAGLDAFNSWPDANGIEIDPRYGLRTVDGVLTPIDTNLSVAVSDTAKAGLKNEPDVAYANTLPANHRCG